MQEPTELQKLKYWLDYEISLMHIYLAVIGMMVANNAIITFIGIAYCIYTFVYVVVRLAYLAKYDPKYLKVPKE